jgi:hypothetical protein
MTAGIPADRSLARCPPHEEWTDPSDGRTYCTRCGLEIPSQPVQIGGRLVPTREYLGRVEERRRNLDRLQERIQAQIDALDAEDGRIRGVRCAWPGCDSAPMIGSKWCRLHKHEREKEPARERQRRRRSGP